MSDAGIDLISGKDDFFNKAIFQAYIRIILSLFFIANSYSLKAQKTVTIKDSEPQHIFIYDEVKLLEDKDNSLTFSDVLRPSVAQRFVSNKAHTPKVFNLSSTYWYKIKLKFFQESKEKWILEFFDQTIDEITVFYPDNNNKYKSYQLGDIHKFNKRDYRHKNFTLDLENNTNSEKLFYIKLKSSQPASVIIVLRSVKWFLEYAVSEYLYFGLFYGMIIIFGFYNLLMFFAIKQKQYLYYVIYNLSIGLFEMSADGVAFQYLWPNSPLWNQYSSGVALFISSIGGLLFTIHFLYLRSKAPQIYRAILAVVLLRIIFFLAGFVNYNLFTYKLIDFIPLCMALYGGIYVWKRGYRPARFFVFGYSFLFIGVFIKILVLINVPWLHYGPITYYSLSFCFVMEMVLVSFAIGDNVRHLRKRKDAAQKRVITQLQVNEKLKDSINEQLNSLVEERTKEVVEKSIFIEHQNEELFKINSLLQKKTEEISLMNILLEQDNKELTVNVEKVSKARVMSKEVDFSEFSKIYPDREACFKFLSDLKWKNGYGCKKCGSLNYSTGQLPYSKRCSKCRYEESVLAHTIFQNSRISINKAFYMLFLIYTTKGKISSHKLSEILSIRQNTCWVYGSKMKKVMEERKKELKSTDGEGGWSKLVLE